MPCVVKRTKMFFILSKRFILASLCLRALIMPCVAKRTKGSYLMCVCKCLKLKHLTYTLYTEYYVINTSDKPYILKQFR